MYLFWTLIPLPCISSQRRTPPVIYSKVLRNCADLRIKVCNILEHFYRCAWKVEELSPLKILPKKLECLVYPKARKELPSNLISNSGSRLSTTCIKSIYICCFRTVSPSPLLMGLTCQVEKKGRTNTNLQDERHECDRRGVRSKCHVCEDIKCDEDLGSTCEYQLQGVSL